MDNKSNIFIDIEKKGNGAKQAKDEVKDLKKNVQDINKTLSSAVITATLSKVSQKLMEAVKKSSDYIETLNLLDVAYNGNTKAVRDFTKQYSEILNLDDSTLISSAAHFKVLSQSMGLATETGEKFAKLLTQMTLDVSSLYNIDFKKAQTALQYAVEGRGTSLKQRTGVSVLETSVQTTLDNLGIDAVVEDMNDAEKAIARLISMEYQLQSSQGDLARTIEAPANQFRVLGEQATMAGRNIGNIFLSAVANVLPYINGLMIALNKILAAIASLFGYSEGMFDFFDSGDVGSITDSFNDLGGAVSGVGSSADKTRKKLLGLRGFDRLNVIKTPTESKGSGGGGGGTGVNPKLLDAFNKMADLYDSKLAGVRTKATEISEQILKWLGFTKKLNPETGKIELKYQGLKTTLKNMWESYKKLNPLLKIAVGYFAIMFGSKLIRTAKNLISVIGNSGLLKAISKLLSPTKQMLGFVNDYIGKAPTLKSAIKTGIDDWKAQATAIERASVGLTGFIAAAGGLYTVKKSMDDVNESGHNLSNTLGLVGGSLSTILGGALIGGSIGGGTGALVGGIVGAIASITTALLTEKTAYEQLTEQAKESSKEYEEWAKTIQAKRDAVEEDLNLTISQQDWNSKLVDELYNIVDANGKVKAGYEDRANFIVGKLNDAYGLELSITDGKINKNKDEIQSIKDVIEMKKAQIILEAKEELYVEALKKKGTAYQNVKKAADDLNKTNTTYNNLIAKQAEFENALGTEKFRTLEYTDKQTNKTYKGMEAYLMLNDAVNETNEQLKIHQDNLNTAKGVYEGYVSDINDYTQIYTSMQKGEYDKVNSYVESFGTTVKVNGETVRVTLADQLAESKFYSEQMIEDYKNKGIKITQSEIDTANQTYNTMKESLVNQSQLVEDTTPEIVAAWTTLAKLSKDDFLTEFAKLPPEVQTEVVDKMQEKGYNISKELQEGINKINPTIEIKTDGSSVQRFFSSIDTTIKGKKYKLNTDVNGVVSLVKAYAQGGLPSVGQMFIANERGPELVGQIGGQSFVANQNQMLDIIDKKLQSAGGGVNNATFIIKVGSEEIGKTVLRDLNKMARTNGQTITIGG